jgi:protein-L-isoaspartate(D-aspartate) O-methyltransferase
MVTSFEKARFNMIQQQIRPWDVADQRVLNAMGEIPRERFVPDVYRGLAYADIEVPIGVDGAQSMLAPKVVGRMLQALGVREDDRVLEIGTGTGYVTACLARLARSVISLESESDLADQAKATLGALSVGGVDVRVADALADAIEGGPFDAIAVTGSMPDDTPLGALQVQLAPGGRLFAIVGEAPAMEALLVTRIGAGPFKRPGAGALRLLIRGDPPACAI